MIATPTSCYFRPWETVVILKQLCPCHPHGRAGFCFWLAALAWPILSTWGHEPDVSTTPLFGFINGLPYPLYSLSTPEKFTFSNTSKKNLLRPFSYFLQDNPDRYYWCTKTRPWKSPASHTSSWPRVLQEGSEKRKAKHLNQRLHVAFQFYDSTLVQSTTIVIGHT